MSHAKPPIALADEDYQAIESALLASERGRRFLSEYARRNRTADTQVLLDAIGRLEAAVEQPRAAANDLIYRDLLEMREAIAHTRRQIVALKLPTEHDSPLTTATEELDAIVQMTEKATCDILGAVEGMQEASWQLRETAPDAAMCDRLDRLAADIYAACGFQDLTGQRTAKVVHTLRFIEARLESMIEIWGLDDLEIEAPGAVSARAAGPKASDRDAEACGLTISFEDIEIVDRDAPYCHPSDIMETNGGGMQTGGLDTDGGGRPVAATETRPPEATAPADRPAEPAVAEPAARRATRSEDFEGLPELDLDDLNETQTNALFS